MRIATQKLRLAAAAALFIGAAGAWMAGIPEALAQTPIKPAPCGGSSDAKCWETKLCGANGCGTWVEYYM